MERKRRRGINIIEEKRNIITVLINKYDIKIAKDIQDILKDLLRRTIQEMLESLKIIWKEYSLKRVPLP